jgi:hypothetical protein
MSPVPKNAQNLLEERMENRLVAMAKAIVIGFVVTVAAKAIITWPN